MQWFEKIYKEKFSSENTQGTDSGLDGINSSELWAQISKSIPQEEPTKIVHHWWRALGILLILSLFTSGLIFFNNNNNNTHTSDQAVTENNTTSVKQNYKPKSKNLSTSLKNKDLLLQDSNTQKSNSKDLKSRDLIIQDLNTKNSISKSTNKNLEPKKPIPTSIADSEPNDINTSVTKPINKDNIFSSLNTRTLPNQKEAFKKYVQSDQKVLSNHLDLNTDNTKSSIDISDQNRNVTDTAQDAQSIISTNDEVNSLENQNTSGSISMSSTLDSRAEINIDKLVHDWNQSPERNIKSPLINPFITPTNITKSPSPWSIKFNTQINIFDLQYKDDTNAETFAEKANKSVDSLQYGHGLGVHLGYSLNRTWTLSVGLESNQYKNQLNTIISTDTTALDSNQNIRKAKITRTIKHTDTLNTITIPLNISYDYRLNDKFGLGTSIGFAYSLVTSQSGRILGRNNSIIDFDSDLNKQFGNYFSLRFNPYIRYQLFDNFDISLDVGFSMQNHGSSLLVDLKQRSSISTIGLGLKYSFN